MIKKKLKTIEISFDELKITEVEANVVTGEMTAHNTFENSEVVKTEELKDVEINDKRIKVVLPPCSVVGLRVK